MLGHQFGQDFVLGLDLLLQELNPLLLLLDLTDGRSFAQKPEDLASEGDYATTDFEDATANNNRAETQALRSAGKREEAALYGPTLDLTKEWFDPRMPGTKRRGASSRTLLLDSPSKPIHAVFRTPGGWDKGTCAPSKGSLGQMHVQSFRLGEKESAPLSADNISASHSHKIFANGKDFVSSCHRIG